MTEIIGYKEKGHLDFGLLEPALKAALPKWNRCYENALAEDPHLRGGVVLHVVVDALGRAKSVANELPDAEIKGTTDLSSRDAVTCVIDETFYISFPPAESEAVHAWIALKFEPEPQPQ